ncbi:hypothetical protein Q7P37_003841 [Cladosporium fusiforme]
MDQREQTLDPNPDQIVIEVIPRETVPQLHHPNHGLRGIQTPIQYLTVYTDDVVTIKLETNNPWNRLPYVLVIYNTPEYPQAYYDLLPPPDDYPMSHKSLIAPIMSTQADSKDTKSKSNSKNSKNAATTDNNASTTDSAGNVTNPALAGPNTKHETMTNRSHELKPLGKPTTSQEKDKDPGSSSNTQSSQSDTTDQPDTSKEKKKKPKSSSNSGKDKKDASDTNQGSGSGTGSKSGG